MVPAFTTRRSPVSFDAFSDFLPPQRAFLRSIELRFRVVDPARRPTSYTTAKPVYKATRTRFLLFFAR
jgi:hypothetical protein